MRMRIKSILRYAAFFFVTAVITSIIGLTSFAAGAFGAAKILLALFFVEAMISFLLHNLAGSLKAQNVQGGY